MKDRQRQEACMDEERMVKSMDNTECSKVGRENRNDPGGLLNRLRKKLLLKCIVKLNCTHSYRHSGKTSGQILMSWFQV